MKPTPAILAEAFYGVPWMISEPRMQEINDRIDLFLKGSFSWDSGNDREEVDFQIVNGVAIIPVKGILSTHESFWSWWFGGTSYDGIRQSLQQASRDTNIKAILLDVDTPGGACKGCPELADDIFAARAEKPIWTFASGDMCSAGLYLGTAAEQVIVSKSSTVGSLGVILARRDWSGYDKQMGFKTHLIKSGEAKSDGHGDVPMSDGEASRLQATVDSLFEMFLSSVAQFRGSDVEVLRASAGDARLFIGREAIAPGLANRLGTLPEVLAELSRDPNPDLPNPTGKETDVEQQPESRSRYARRIRNSR